MHRFEVVAESKLIGHTELESGDAPMGVASGVFLPLPSYAELHKHTTKDGSKEPEGVRLIVRVSATGQEVECQAGVHIADHSAELGPDGIEITVLGIGYPAYAELFPEHVEAYNRQFS